MSIQSTGRSRDERRSVQSAGSDSGKAAYSISEFCRDHSISRGLFYKLKKLGLTPREIELGSRRIITREAAADWRAQNTAA